MAEVQKSTNAGESSARFIEFVMLQAQNASLFLGLIPHPQSGEPETNLDLARMFIDQLAMIQEKTRGNLSTEESGVLRNALSRLQMAYVEVSQGEGGMPGAGTHSIDEPDAAAGPTDSVTESSASASPSASGTAAAPATPVDESRESRKRFSKSYGS